MNDVVGEQIDFAALVQNIPDSLVVVDSAINLVFVNQAGVELLGWKAEDWHGRSLLELVHPDDVAVMVSSATTVLGKSHGTPVEVRVRCADDSWRRVEIVGRDAFDHPGVRGLVIMVRDITQRRMWEVAAGDTAVFQQLVQHGSSITLLLDDAGRISSVNAAFTRLLGHDPSLTVDHCLVEFCAPGSAADLETAVELARSSGSVTSCEVAMRNSDPTVPPRPIRFEIVNLLDDPVIGGFVVTGHDVSDLHRARRSLEHLARHDALTGLANRSVLIEQLEQIIATRQPTAAVFIDLDRFKPVNDLFGHEAGDELLCEVSERLRRVVRQGDLVARVGGDEFVVLAVGVDDLATGQAFCDRIDASLAEPYLLADGPVRLTASVGLALRDAESTVTGLLADADLAMYEAKAERRGEPLGRDPHRQRTANERRKLADDLAVGLHAGEVVAYLQPLVELASNRTVEVEALARWNHPTLDTLGPMAFLDLAEDAGLDLQLGDAVLRSACQALQGLPQPLRLGINLSVAQLTDRGLAARIAGILREYSLPPERLVVEITERDTLARRAGVGRAAPERTLTELREMGASLALDDFGTGYSSLTHIRRYTLNSVKIDRTFVAGVCTHPEDRAVVAAVVGMAGALGLQVVAEGVETDEQYDTLRELGCTMAQGFLIAHPMTAAEMRDWMETRGDDWRHPVASLARRSQ
ncbi:MAG: EAL domain-containing protein [Acidimicrobiaceae bacterium]|nr:EAL domain-containing protein [Acidimicrobiaceae bacterium]